MTAHQKMDHVLLLAVVGLAAWAVPGAGHLLIKERLRAAIIFVTITATFVTGLYVGSIGVIDPVGAKPWYMAQMLTSPAVGLLWHVTETAVTADGQQRYVSYGRCCDVGQIYTSGAGRLNLLCILSAVYMAYCGRGEMIGEEEHDG